MKENPEGIKDHLSISGKVSHFPLSTKHLAKSATVSGKTQNLDAKREKDWRVTSCDF